MLRMACLDCLVDVLGALTVDVVHCFVLLMHKPSFGEVENRILCNSRSPLLLNNAKKGSDDITHKTNKHVYFLPIWQALYYGQTGCRGMSNSTFVHLF